MPLITREGKPSIYYRIDDFTDPWLDAPYLILQHGYGRSSKFWYQWVPYLSRFYKVIRPDLRGLGDSDKDFDPTDPQTGLTAQNYVEDMRALVAALGDKPVHICGESIGGIVGAAFAGLYPNLVKSLTMISAPVFFTESAKKVYANGYGSWPEAVRAMGPEAWLQATNTSTRFPPDMPAGFLEFYNRNTAEAGVDMLAAMAEFALAGNITPFLPTIAAPTLVLYPTGGAVASDDQRKVLEDNIPNVRFLHLPTRFHMIHYIQPALCARQVLAFAASIDGRVCDE